jgi:hypothetical protein
MSNITRARAIELILFDLNALVNPLLWYEATAGLEESCFYIRFTNSGPNYILVSYDRGVTAHDVVPPDSTIEVYFQSNASYSQKTNNLAKGTPIYLQGTGSNDDFYLSGYTYTE